MNRNGPSIRRGGAAAIAATWMALGSLAPARAQELKDSLNCRKEIAKAVEGVLKTGLKLNDKCHKDQNKLAATGDPGDCNTIAPPPDPFDPPSPKTGLGKYDPAKQKGTEKIDLKCLPGDPVLDNHPGGDPDGALYPLIDGAIEGHSVLAVGNTLLEGTSPDPKQAEKERKARAKCVETVGKARTGVITQILKVANKCQKDMDKLVLDPNDLGDLDPACLQEALDAANLIDPVTLKLKGSIPKGEAKINKDCFVDTNDDDILDTPLDGTGTCSPVPDCALDSATTVATELAEATYNALAAATSECGNVILETGEQCDDGDTDPGDGCNATCELEGQSCGTPIGPRTVTIAINTPQTLAGVRVDLDYPQFQAGIQGTGQSSIVQSQVSILQGIPGDFISIANDRETDLTVVIGSAGAFINTGDLIEVAMDACVALAQNLCNRNQNIIGCCQNPGECADPNLPPSCTSFPLTEVGAGTPAGCCPADNACVSQTTATTCSVSGAVDENGVEIPGVTCTITITGT